MFFIHLLVLLIVFLSQASSISSSHTALPHQQQNGGILHQIRFFGCKLKKTNGGILLCDPSAFLRPRERHTLRQRMKQFLAETGNPGEQNDCRRRGVAVGVVLLDRRSDEEVQAIPRQSISDLARQLDPECDKFVQLLLPAHELNRTAIIHGSGVPLQEEQLQLVIELQKSLLQQNRYFEAISGILEGIHLLLENTDAHQREQNIKSDKLGGQREETMTQASLALVASCAVLFSLMLSICTFAAFYYVAIVRDGGLACWGDAGSKAPRSGVYFVKEVSIEETTVDFCGEKTPP